MKNPRLQRLLPKPETLQRNRWLRWLGPRLLHPRLWHFRRRAVAMGAALGVFFGLLVPLAQIPLAAGASVILRANLPTAVASTLVTNPLTFPPVYYAAWKLGQLVLGEGLDAAPPPAAPLPAPEPAPAAAGASAPPAPGGFWQRVAAGVTGIGKPLLVGLPVMACIGGLLVYFGVAWGWAWKVRWVRRRRARLRAAGRAP